MENREELNLEAMEQVTGGVRRVVDTRIDGVSAAVRSGASKDSQWIAALPSGTAVDTVTDELVYDSGSGRNYVQINFTDKNGRSATGWIAASIVGLPR